MRLDVKKKKVERSLSWVNECQVKKFEFKKEFENRYHEKKN